MTYKLSDLTFLPDCTVLSRNGCDKTVRFILFNICFVKEPLVSLEVHSRNNIVPTVTFHWFMWQMFTQYQWHLNPKPMPLMNDDEKGAPPFVPISHQFHGHNWNVTSLVQIYQHRWQETKPQRDCHGKRAFQKFHRHISFWCSVGFQVCYKIINSQENKF